MNETECDNLIKSVKWTEPSNLISLAILEFINVLVIGGNLLVIAAVFCSNKLRSVTNFFIVNLAVADLLVGLAVLPFSATWEVFKVWIFGDVWCRIWLAVDVWMCTASILNLCAISLDRYVAVTRPVTYPSIMSTKKAKSLIAGIWVLSFVICFPPLVGWKDQKPVIQPTYTKGNYTLYYATSTTAMPTEAPAATATMAATPPPLSSSSSATVSSTIESIAAMAAPASLKHKANRQRMPFEMTKATTTNAHYPMPPPLPVSVAKALRHSRKLTFKSTPPPYRASSLYNSFNPYDPYDAHLKYHNATNKNLNNQFVVDDTDSAAQVTLQNNNSPADIHGNTKNNNINNINIIDYNNNNNENDDADAGADTDNSAAAVNDDDDNDDEYVAKASGSSESTSIRYHNDPTSALYYDTLDAGQQMKSIDSTASATTTSAAASSTSSSSASTTSSYATPAPAPPPCPWKCELTNDRGYVLYSALGSFYIPMFVMLFFYWRIYRAAVRTTRAINQGFKTTKGSPHESGTNRVDETQLVLRIHRGRPCTTPQRTPLSVHSMSSTLSVNSNNEDMYPLQHHSQLGQQQGTIPKRATSMKVPRTKHEKVSIKVSFPSSENMLDSTTSINSTPPAYAEVVSSTTISGGQQTASGSLINGRRSSFKSSLFEIGETTFNVDTSNNVDSSAATHSSKMIEAHADSLMKKNDKKQRSKRSVKFQVKRFKVETKAAKTLAIIVGGFIFCWLPFFTMYLIRAFCDHCIQPTVFSVLFWLGYCNSAINPLIYALFSHEFRIAFKRIVCRCVCTRSGFRASENFQMIAARALMAPATFHKTISGCSDEGDGPEFS